MATVRNMAWGNLDRRRVVQGVPAVLGSQETPACGGAPARFTGRAGCRRLYGRLRFAAGRRHKVVLTALSGGHYHSDFALAPYVIEESTRTKAMEKKQSEQFRKVLEERQRLLRESVVRAEQDGRTADASDAAQDIADRASSSYQKEFLFHQSSNDRQLLQLVEGALGRIREGSFGECVSCAEEINPKRLEAVPWARYCISCQEKLEQGLLQEETDK